MTKLTHALRAALLLCTGAGIAVTLIGFASHTPVWGELTTPALLGGGLAAYGLGTLCFGSKERS